MIGWLPLGNVRVLEYGALVWLCFHLFVLVYEEPTLRGDIWIGIRGFLWWSFSLDPTAEAVTRW